MKRDESDDLPSSSSREYFEHADHGKAQQEEKKAKETAKLSSLKRDLLKADIKKPDDKKKEVDQLDPDDAQQIAQQQKLVQKETKVERAKGSND